MSTLVQVEPCCVWSKVYVPVVVYVMPFHEYVEVEGVSAGASIIVCIIVSVCTTLGIVDAVPGI